jgi:hypothetical protein
MMGITVISADAETGHRLAPSTGVCNSLDDTHL